MTKKIPSPLITPSPLISACYLRATIPVLDALQSTMQKKGAQKQKHIRRDFQKKGGGSRTNSIPDKANQIPHTNT
ncbi:TPA: hypothetical protein ACH9P2_004404, partial [Escherichia coli]